MDITLTPGQLASIASLVNAASKDDMRPIITGVHLELDGNTLTAIATDRYRIARARYKVEVPETAETEAGVTVPSALLTRAAKTLTGTRFNREQPIIRLTVVDSVVTFADFEDTVSGQAVAGNYPPVGRLFPDMANLPEVACQGVYLNPAYLAALSKLHGAGEKATAAKTAAWAMHGTGETPNGKPKPVIFTRAHVGGDKGELLEYLLQPEMPR